MCICVCYVYRYYYLVDCCCVFRSGPWGPPRSGPIVIIVIRCYS